MIMLPHDCDPCRRRRSQGMQTSDTPQASQAISAFGTPSAASRMIRTRFARPDGTLGSRARSPSF
jgi:hypothetical protein